MASKHGRHTRLGGGLVLQEPEDQHPGARVLSRLSEFLQRLLRRSTARAPRRMARRLPTAGSVRPPTLRAPRPMSTAFRSSRTRPTSVTSKPTSRTGGVRRAHLAHHTGLEPDRRHTRVQADRLAIAADGTAVRWWRRSLRPWLLRSIAERQQLAQRFLAPALWKVNTSYQLDKTNLVYATWSQGFRRGGVNALPPTEPGRGLRHAAGTDQATAGHRGQL